MTDTHILPKWLYSLSVLSVIGVFYGIAKFCRYKITLNVNFCHAVFLIVALLQVVYAYLQGVGVFHSYFAFKMVGSFDNPVGLATCACVGISSCLYLFRNAHSKLLRYILVLILILLCSMLFLSGSRAGILGGMLLLLYYIWCYILKKGVIRFLFIIAVIPMFIGMYFVKKDSADGRILILQCCWDMIKERPILGHGFGAFEAHYMDYQAAYFALHPNSHYSILADNVKHAFNEFIMILVEFGIVGFLCLLFIVFVLWLCYYRAPSWEREIAFLSMLSIAVIACFSFPLTSPFVWLVLVFDVWVLVRPLLPNIRQFTKTIIMMFVISLSILMLYSVGKRIMAEYEWWKIVNCTPRNNKDLFFARYETLMPVLGNEPYFLYNYSVELYIGGKYEEALRIAEVCRKYWADYDLELLQGECCMLLKNYERAMSHYTLASQMCPVRFIPLYRIYKLYKTQGLKKQAQNLGLQILKKTIKIPSPTIDMIKNDVHRTLNSY